MRKTDLTTNTKPKLVLFGIKSAEENKNALPYKEKLVLRQIKDMLLERMPITCNTNSQN